MFGGVHDVEALSTALNDVTSSASLKDKRRIIGKISRLHCKGVVVESAYPAVVKYLASSDVLLKKLVCWFVAAHSGNPEVNLLCQETLSTDSADPNPVIRCVALNTLLSLEDDAQVSKEQLVQRALADKAAVVRRSAVLWAGGLGAHGKEDVVDTLYSLLRDPDSQVVCNCVYALDRLLVDEGGIVINSKICQHLVSSLTSFDQFGQLMALTVLQRYTPGSDAEILDLLNALDPYLRHHAPAVTWACLRLFLTLMTRLPQLREDLWRRLVPHVTSLLDSGDAESAWSLLQELRTHVPAVRGRLAPHIHVLVPNYNDPVYLQTAKLEMLEDVLTSSSTDVVMDDVITVCETTEYSDVQERVVKLLARHSQIEVMLELLYLHVDNVSCAVLESFADMTSLTDSQADLVTARAVQLLDSLVTSRGRCAVIRLLGVHGARRADVVYVLEDIIQPLLPGDHDGTSRDVLSEGDCDVMSEVLLALLRLYTCRPAQVQHLLGDVMERCHGSADPDLRLLTEFCYDLLCDRRALRAALGVCD